MKNKPQQPRPVEGEGSYSATRRYNRHLASALASGGLEGAAEQARHALDSPQGDELGRAAAVAKKGPKLASGSASGRKVAAPT